jgi:hypothetical protein
MRKRRLVVIAAGAVLALLVPSGAAQAAAGDYRLNPGEALTSEQRLVSPDGQYVLVMQTDGNLVEYAPGNRATWATGTSSQYSDLEMQGDGNLVVYQPGHVAIWSTGTAGALHLEVQNDGNLVVYTNDSAHAARWSAAAITNRDDTGQARYNGYVAMRDRGWADSEWSCLDSLWNGESGWRWNATNASSGAYGIPQALPAGKMASAGGDWHDNPATQIQWGLTYIANTYGSPCNAYHLWLSRSPHWY